MSQHQESVGLILGIIQMHCFDFAKHKGTVHFKGHHLKLEVIITNLMRH